MVEEDTMKETEIGLLPKDWEVANLGDIGIVIIGLTYSPVNVSDHGTLVLRSSNIQKNRLAFDNNVFVNMDLPERVITKAEDLLICVRNGSRDLIGKSTLIDEQTAGAAFGAFMSVYRSEYNEYISRVFQSGIVQQQIQNNLGATINQITNKDLISFKIPLPPLPEQGVIAKVLSDADAWIESLEQLIAKKRLIKQGAMQELLTPKEDWQVKKLGEVITSTQLGGNYPNSEIETENPLIKMGNIQRGKISLKKTEYISPNVAPVTKDLLRENDLLFNTRNTLELVGKVCIWRKELKTAYFNSNIMRIAFNKDIITSNVLMNAVFNSRKMVQHLKDIATGTTSVAAIYTRDLLGIEISFPASLNEQIHISTILSDMDMEMECLESQLAKVRLIKQGMMDELLTGKTRFL